MLVSARWRSIIRHELSLLFAVIFLPSFVAAQSFDLPDYPRPPTEQDCRSFQAALEDYYRRADDEYRSCYNGRSDCGDAPGRRGAAASRRGQIAVCFFSAQQRSSKESVVEFLKRENRDSTIRELGRLGSEIYEAHEKLTDLLELRSKAKNFSKLNAVEKIDFYSDLIAKLNLETSARNELSRKLLDDAHRHTTEIHKDALSQLERELKRIESNHLQLIGRQNAEISRVGFAAPPAISPSVKPSSELDRMLAEARKKAAGREQKLQDIETNARNQTKSAAERLAPVAKAGREALMRERAAYDDQKKQAYMAQCRANTSDCHARCNPPPDVPLELAAPCSNVCSASLEACVASAYGTDEEERDAFANVDRMSALFQQAILEAEQRAADRSSAAEAAAFFNAFSNAFSALANNRIGNAPTASSSGSPSTPARTPSSGYSRCPAMSERGTGRC
jgi:hypothetical protein